MLTDEECDAIFHASGLSLELSADYVIDAHDRALIRAGYAAAAGPPRERGVMYSVDRCMQHKGWGWSANFTAVAGGINANIVCPICHPPDAAPPAASAAPTTEYAHGFHAGVTHGAKASAAPKADKSAGQLYGEDKRAMDRERMSRRETTAEDLIDPPTPDDGRSDAELLRHLDEWRHRLPVEKRELYTEELIGLAAARLRELLAERADILNGAGSIVGSVTDAASGTIEALESRLALAVGLLTELVAWVDRTQVPLLVTPAGLTLSTSYVDNVALDNARAFLAPAKTGGGK